MNASRLPNTSPTTPPAELRHRSLNAHTKMHIEQDDHSNAQARPAGVVCAARLAAALAVAAAELARRRWPATMGHRGAESRCGTLPAALGQHWHWGHFRRFATHFGISTTTLR